MVDEEYLRHRIALWIPSENNICSALGEDVLNDQKCQMSFKKFHNGNLSLENEAHSGLTSDFNTNASLDLLIQYNQATKKEL